VWPRHRYGAALEHRKGGGRGEERSTRGGQPAPVVRREDAVVVGAGGCNEPRGDGGETRTPADFDCLPRGLLKAGQASLGIRRHVVAQVDRPCTGFGDQPENLLDPVALTLLEARAEAPKGLVELRKALREEADPKRVHPSAGPQRVVVNEGADHVRRLRRRRQGRVVGDAKVTREDDQCHGGLRRHQVSPRPVRVTHQSHNRRPCSSFASRGRVQGR